MPLIMANLSFFICIIHLKLEASFYVSTWPADLHVLDRRVLGVACWIMEDSASKITPSVFVKVGYFHGLCNQKKHDQIKPK